MLASLLPLAGCGGSGDGGAGSQQPFTFRWHATVTAIEDGSLLPAGMPGVQVGDALVAHVDYDPALFADGISVDGGRQYAAPAGGLEMICEFSSGGRFTKLISGARVRDSGAFDQLTWRGGDFGGLLAQVSDYSDVSLTLPFPIGFSTMHAQFAAEVANFQLSNASLEFPDANPALERRISLSPSAFQLIAN